MNGGGLSSEIDVAFVKVQQFMFQHDNGFVTGDSLAQLPPGILGGSGDDDTQSGYIHQRVFQAL